ncbi:hypothetical protein ADIARSV_3004 [Arcticibacter svalbardensis MN12-7]|uniref:Uncharacterized protein n=1 Tax=Arcticibacter svalbardensis MN12-7 TaxID=1150600 RepID=R9GPU6_9SPHI|nr:DUF6266 family protein [Arcticibacter svalbardensis]EOR93867.1 hypothetical protein ADIARSV_3004 [Arcticibacter svalbardensis MN12-7]
MAIIESNRISGLLGNLVYYIDRSGKQRTRKRPVFTVSPSDKQLGTRLKFKMAMNFLNPLRALINKSWHGDLRRGIMSYDAALGTMIKQAIDGEYPDLCITYSKVQISRGIMDGPINLTLEIMGDEAVVTWEILPVISKASSPDDILMFVLVNESKEITMLFEQKALRGDLSLKLALPATFGNDALHGFFFFSNHNFKEASATTYLKYRKTL